MQHIAVFMVFYKALWLIVVAYPLRISYTLKGKPPEEPTCIFIWAMAALPFIPWKYFLFNYIIPTKNDNR
tara:strand:- start:1183 stop:1392 length:210 start_codon:yes stop_codon:yes gene_type:complete